MDASPCCAAGDARGARATFVLACRAREEPGDAGGGARPWVSTAVAAVLNRAMPAGRIIMTDHDLTSTSKFLSLVLRHKPETVGVTLDPAGWIGVDELLAACARHGRRISREQLERVVATSDKKRFALSEDGTQIRAN